jgi:PAS domain S-box-containing protein
MTRQLDPSNPGSHPSVGRRAAGATLTSDRSRSNSHEAPGRASGKQHAVATARIGVIYGIVSAVGMVGNIPAWRAFTGQTRRRSRGRGWLEAVHPLDRSRIEAIWQQTALSSGPVETTFWLRRADGVYRWMLARAAPVLSGPDTIQQWVCTCVDVTDVTHEADVTELPRERTAEAARSGQIQRSELARPTSANGATGLTELAPRREPNEQCPAAQPSGLEPVLDMMADGAVVLDSTGAVAYANASFRTLLALDARPDLTTSPLKDCWQPFNPRDEHGQPVAEDQCPPVRVLRGEVLAGASAVDIILRPLVGHDVRVSVSAAPIRDAAGSVRGGIILFRDVTERRRLEQRTRDALNALLEMAEVLVHPPEEAPAGWSAEAGWDEDSIHATSNAAAQRLVELTRSVLGGTRISIIAIHQDTGAQRPVATIRPTLEEERLWWRSVPRFRLQDYVSPHLIRRLRAGEVVQTDLTQQPARPDRPTYGGHTALVAPMQVQKQLMGLLILNYGADAPGPTPDAVALVGAIAKLAALVLDRERILHEWHASKASAEALEEANRKMDEFLAIATHELRAPVTSSALTVHNALRQLLRDPAQSGAVEAASQLAPLQGLLARADESMERLGRLMSYLLDVTRMRMGKLELQLESCDLVDVVRDAVDQQRQIAPNRTIRLHLPSARTVSVTADADRIGQVVTNYLSNALKYSAADRPVRVDIRTEGEWARVSVRDEGSGLTAEQQEHVWERFYRGDQAYADGGASEGGLGLGLYISNAIIEGHHGHVGVDSAPGKGSTFWFALPIAPAAAATDRAHAQFAQA